MDYQIENLGPERFQQLCQSLLIGEFPGVQCLPVAQPDGGRDAFTHGSAGTLEAVFQVKFLRRPDSWNDVVEWLESTIDSEIDKVRNLAERGAKSYYLLTNALGTAHPTTGSVDRLQTQLDRLPIPAQCWWRDDICRRLDRAWDVKWRYPELLTGVDLLRLLVENRLVDSEPQRAIRAFVVDQYEKEREVKFKQVELQNRLLDLFVDVPLAYLDERVGRDVRFERQSLFKALVSQVRRPAGRARAMHSSYPASMRDDAIIGGARLLLSDLTQERLRKVVIEGAPGQGKSTISQFICQVHRIRILNNLDAAILPEWQRSCRLRLPFKIDLRDLAAWLDGLDPFYPEEVTQQPSKVKKSLESFLAAQIRFHSGGTNFSVDNLLSVLAVSPTLLVFDGLDEVGKRQQRQSVIEEITNGVRRLESNCPDLQVVVTSRPAAFSLSPGLPASEYAHFSLAQLSREIIDEYTEKGKGKELVQ